MWRFNNQEKEKEKEKEKKEFLSFCVASAARCLPRSPLAPSLPTAGPARNTLRSYCRCVVASEFIMTRVVRQWS
jgi:hypothetical protein